LDTALLIGLLTELLTGGWFITLFKKPFKRGFKLHFKSWFKEGFKSLFKRHFKSRFKSSFKGSFKSQFKGHFKSLFKGQFKTTFKSWFKKIPTSFPYGINRDNFDGKIHPIRGKFSVSTGGIH